LVDRRDSEVGDGRERDGGEREGVVEHKIGELVGGDEPAVGGPTPSEVTPAMGRLTVYVLLVPKRRFRNSLPMGSSLSVFW
jgi:hypothetical protein